MKKFFRVVVEGATTDGRVVDRAMIEQMAKNYDPTYYCAQINIEHIRGIHPESTFKRYGKVAAVKSEEIKEGKLAGKLALFAELDPTEELKALNKTKQKQFTSVEINPSFSDTNEAYLVGLAVTDDPASLGTELLKFSATAQQNPLASRKQDPQNLFTSSEECEIVLDFDENTPSDTSIKLSDLKNKILSLFKKENEKKGDFSLLVENMESLIDLNQHLQTDFEQKLEAHKAEIFQFRQELNELQTALSMIPNTQARPLSTGKQEPTELQTDC